RWSAGRRATSLPGQPRSRSSLRDARCGPPDPRPTKRSTTSTPLRNGDFMQTGSDAPARLEADDVAAIDQLRESFDQLTGELSRMIVVQRRTIENLAIGLFARGHDLLMGIPGLAKTLLVSRLAETMHLKFSRIQFTPDLMPMDITGSDILQEVPG